MTRGKKKNKKGNAPENVKIEKEIADKSKNVPSSSKDKASEITDDKRKNTLENVKMEIEIADKSKKEITDAKRKNVPSAESMETGTSKKIKLSSFLTRQRKNNNTNRPSDLGEYQCCNKDGGVVNVSIDQVHPKVSDDGLIAGYVERLAKGSGKGCLPILHYMDYETRSIVLQPYKWSLSDAIAKNKISIFEDDIIDPTIKTSLYYEEEEEEKGKVKGLSSTFKRTCKAILRGLRDLFELKLMFFSLTPENIIFTDSDIEFTSPKFVDMYEFAGDHKIHTVFSKFLLDRVIESFSETIVDNPTDSDRLSRYKEVLTPDLYHLFLKLKTSCDIEKLLSHPSLMDKGEKLRKTVDIRRSFKKNGVGNIKAFRELEREMCDGYSWQHLANGNIYLTTMFKDHKNDRTVEWRLYDGDVMGMVFFFRDCSEHLNDNTSDFKVGWKRQTYRDENWDDKDMNRVVRLEWDQIEELLERVFPKFYTCLFDHVEPNIWMLNTRFLS